MVQLLWKTFEAPSFHSASNSDLIHINPTSGYMLKEIKAGFWEILAHSCSS